MCVSFRVLCVTFPSYHFGDAAVNYDKYEYLLNCPYKAVFVTFWTDCFIMIDVKNCPPDEDIVRYCQHQTRFPDHQIIRKKMVRWKLQNIAKLKSKNPTKHQDGVDKLISYFKFYPR